MGTTFTGKAEVRTSAESQSDVDVFIERLRRVGAPADAYVELREQWAAATPEQRAEAMALSERDLRRELHEQHAGDEPAEIDEPVVAVGLAPIEGGGSEGASTPPPSSDEIVVPDDTVQNVLAWAGDDLARVHAALDAELQASEPRVTLVDGLTKALDAHAADA